MSAERVEKRWREQGLSSYSTAAIIGTLNHYGIEEDEAALREATREGTPMALANRWQGRWKGKGQFDVFPYAAANELFERFYPERPTPRRVASAVAEVTVVGVKAVDEGATELGGVLDKVEALLASLPPTGEALESFVRELVAVIDPWAKLFGELPHLLGKAGRKDDAFRFAAIHERLFPERKGCATAVVRAALGEQAPVLAELRAAAEDTGRDVFARYHALDALDQLDGWEETKAVGLGVFDAAAAAGEWRLADSAAHLLGHVVDAHDVEIAFAREVEQRLELAHRQTGGKH